MLHYTLIIFLLNFAIADTISANFDFSKIFNEKREAFENFIGAKLPVSCEPYKKQITVGVITTGALGIGLFCFHNLFKPNVLYIHFSSSLRSNDNFHVRKFNSEGKKIIKFQGEIIENKRFDHPLYVVNGGVTIKNIEVKGDLKINGSASICGIEKAKTGIKIASGIFVNGVVDIDNVITGPIDINGSARINAVTADLIKANGYTQIINSKISKNIFVNGHFSSSELQCKKIKVNGPCFLNRTVVTESVSISLNSKRPGKVIRDAIELRDVMIPELIIESNVIVIVKVCKNSSIGKIIFTNKKGEVIYF